MADSNAPTFPTSPNMSDAYAPLQQNLKDQINALTNRYGQNQADVSNIFGVLSTVAPADRQRVNQQFAESVQQQQEALAARTAEARVNQNQLQHGATQAAGELGGGAAPTDSLSAQATNQGIAQANQTQTNWEGLMGATQAQQLGNIDARQAGYGYQQANALQQLSRDYNTNLLGLQGQQLGLQSQQIQGQIGANAKMAEMAQESALAQAQNQTALGVAQIRAGGVRDAASIRNAYLLQKANNSPSGKVSISDPIQWEKAIRSSNVSLVPGESVGAGLTHAKRYITSLVSGLQAVADKTATDANGGIAKTGKAPTADAVYKLWVSKNPDAKANVKSYIYKAIKSGYYKTW